MRHLTTALTLALLIAPLGACKQTAGDRCQVDSDCESDLICCVDPNDRPIGGTCQLVSACEQNRKSDGGTPPDGAARKDAGAARKDAGTTRKDTGAARKDAGAAG